MVRIFIDISFDRTRKLSIKMMSLLGDCSIKNRASFSKTTCTKLLKPLLTFSIIQGTFFLVDVVDHGSPHLSFCCPSLSFTDSICLLPLVFVLMVLVLQSIYPHTLSKLFVCFPFSFSL